jgi:hypothetical protein
VATVHPPDWTDPEPRERYDLIVLNVEDSAWDALLRVAKILIKMIFARAKPWGLGVPSTVVGPHGALIFEGFRARLRGQRLAIAASGASRSTQ